MVIMHCLSIGNIVSYLEKRMQIKRCHRTQRTQRLHVSKRRITFVSQYLMNSVLSVLIFTSFVTEMDG